MNFSSDNDKIRCLPTHIAVIINTPNDSPISIECDDNSNKRATCASKHILYPFSLDHQQHTFILFIKFFPYLFSYDDDDDDDGVYTFGIEK